MRALNGYTISRNHTELFKAVNWMPLRVRIRYNALKYIFKNINIRNNESNLFEFETKLRSLRYTDPKKLKINTPKSNFYQNSLFFKGLKT